MYSNWFESVIKCVGFGEVSEGEKINLMRDFCEMIWMVQDI